MYMELIQIFSPLRDNQGEPFPFDDVNRSKSGWQKFGGVTAFLNSPGQGVWARISAELYQKRCRDI